MACDLTKGRSKGCKDSIGGNSKLYLFNYLEDAFTIVAGEATAMNVALTVAYEYDLVGDGSTFAEEVVSDRQTQSVTNTQTITAIFNKMDAATAAEFNLMAKGYPIAVIKDRNDNYHLVGQTDGIDFNISGATGGAKSDLNGFTLTGTSVEQNLSPKLDSATTTAFLAVVAVNA
jgi:hypothetical protein